MRAINLLNTEITLGSTSNTVYDSVLVRVISSSTQSQIQRKNYLGQGTASCTVISSEPMYIFKDPGDSLTSLSGFLLATPITFMY